MKILKKVFYLLLIIFTINIAFNPQKYTINSYEDLVDIIAEIMYETKQIPNDIRKEIIRFDDAINFINKLPIK